MATAEPSTTPNPNAMKFTLDTNVGEAINVNSPDAATDPVSSALFAIDGVVAVFATNDFVTVSKIPDGDWDTITPAVQAALADAL